MYKAYLDLSGGLNDTFSDLRLNDNEGSVYRNVNLDRDGAVSKRRGSIKFSEDQIGAALECGGIIYFRPTFGSAEIVTVFGGKIVRYTGTWDELYTTLTPNLVSLLVPFKNLLYLNNGTDNPLVYVPFATGVKVWRPGQPAPTAHPTFNANIAGACTPGNILVRVRYVGFVDDSFVGEPDSEEGTTFTVSASGGLKINIPVYAGVDGFHVAKRLIERTKTADGIFFLDGIVADNTTPTYNIVSADTALEGNDVAPDLGSRQVPSKLFPFCLSRNRIVGWNATERRVEWSTIDEFGILPEAFRQEDYVFLDITDLEDEPIACLQFQDQVIFYCGRSVHRVFIDDGGLGSAFRLEIWEVGIPSARGVIAIPGGHLVWTYKGPRFFDGNDLVPIGERIENFSAGLEAARLKDVFAVHRFDRRQVKFVVPANGAAQLDTAAIYHYRITRPDGSIGQAWTIHEGSKVKSGCMGRDVSTKRDVEFSGDYDGYVRIEDIGQTEDQAADGAIDAAFVTKWLDCNDIFSVKQFRHVWVIVQSEDAGNLTIAWDTEFGAGVSGAEILSVADVLSRFDTATFDASAFAGGQNKVVHAWLAQDGVMCEGRHVRFTISNSNAAETFTVLGLLLEYEPVRDRNDGV